MIKAAVEKVRFTRKALTLIAHIIWGMVLITLLGFWIPSRPNRFKRHVIQRWYQRACRILNLQLSVAGDITRQPCLVVSNHISWLDIIVIGSHIPVHFLSKAEVRQWPIIGWLAACTGTLFIQRGSGESATMANTIANTISSGDSVLVFPEATSTDGKELKRFFPNMFAAVSKTNVPVQPLALEYTEHKQRSTSAPFINDNTFFRHLLLILKNDHINVAITFLPAIQNTPQADKKTLSINSRNAILSVIQPISYDETTFQQFATAH